jgi:hypothetical protein
LTHAIDHGLLQIMDSSKPVVLPRMLMVFPVVFLIAGFAPWLRAEVTSDAEALSYLSAAADQDLPSHAVAGRGARVKIQPPGPDTDRLTFRFPDGTGRVARRNRTITNGRLTSWIGEFEGRPGSIAIMSHGDGETTGFLNDGERLYEIRSEPSGETLFYEVDLGALPPPGAPLSPTLGAKPDPVRNPKFQATQEAHLTATAPVAATGGTVVQDIMLLYTQAVLNFYGNATITESVLRDAVIATNQAYVDSGIDIIINVVHVAEVDFLATGQLKETILQLGKQDDGFIDEVHTWRDVYGADLVTLISVENDPEACGLAFRPYAGFTFEEFDSFMFSVIEPRCLSRGTLAHEIGHNQGICHDRGDPAGCDDDAPPFYPYGWGYCGINLRTLMAASNSCQLSKIQQFSNPRITFAGEPTGIDFDIDPLNSADAVRGINNTAAPLAAFRFPDADMDGMSNEWETDNGLDPNDSSDATGDPDGDALNNRSEFEAGSDPHNPDTDGDAFLDNVDAFPRDASESLDTDGDGIGNNADTDDDNDGVPDQLDDFPQDPSNTPPPDGSSSLSIPGLWILCLLLYRRKSSNQIEVKIAYNTRWPGWRNW